MAEMMMDLLEVGWYGDRERANEPIKEMRALVEEVVPLQESFALSRKHTETGRGAGISPHTASLLLYNEARYTRVRKFVLGFCLQHCFDPGCCGNFLSLHRFSN